MDNSRVILLGMIFENTISMLLYQVSVRAARTLICRKRSGFYFVLQLSYSNCFVAVFNFKLDFTSIRTILTEAL